MATDIERTRAAAAASLRRDPALAHRHYDSTSANPYSTSPESYLHGIHESRPDLLSSRLNVSTTSLCGKRSRSNSSSSSTDYSSDGATSGFSASPSHSSSYIDSPTTSVSSHSSPEEDKERSCPSPSAAKRKTLRCALQDTACTAPSVQHPHASLNAASTPSSTVGHPSSAQSCNSSTASKSDADLVGLGGAVQAFGLNSREQTPEGLDSAVATSHSAGFVESSLSAAAAKGNLRDHFVDAAVATIDAIWHAPLHQKEIPCTASGLPLGIFIRETLRRSRTSCSTLQAALLYCLRTAPAVRRQRMMFMGAPRKEEDPVQALMRQDRAGVLHPLLCGRRMFLASIMVAAKFLQDKNYSNKAWAKLTGLPSKELGAVEREFLSAIKWNLNFKPGEWESWTRKLADAKLCSGPGAARAALGPQRAPLSPAVAKLKSACPATPPSPAPSVSSFSSGASTPTPAKHGASAEASSITSKLSVRSCLARSNSDDAPFKAFDSAVEASSSPVDGIAVTQTLEKLAAQDVAAPRCGACEAKNADAAVPAIVAGITPPAPYPMHRSFVRNAVSFSSTADRLSAIRSMTGTSS